ncbi:MAG: threonine--tRNA ligase [Promethearchaeota archaeon]
MKMLLIHSQDVEVYKKLVATASPQEFDGDAIVIEGLVLVSYISVEDQDTYDTTLISTQAADAIQEAIGLIEGFPAKLREENAKIEAHNEEVEKAGKGKKRPLKSLVLPEESYRVEQVLVYPWAHLSTFLSKDKEAADVFPKTAAILNERGIRASYSPFGWYKAFKINCLGHELAEMHRDIKLAIQPEEHVATAVFKIITPDGELLDLEYNDDGSIKFPPSMRGKENKDLQDFFNAEAAKTRSREVREEPAHIKLMQKLELVDFDENTDRGNFRWYTHGVIFKNLLRQFVQDQCINAGAVLLDTPIMYTVKNKRLTAQTARFPARTYWVISGSDRYLLRFAADFLQFSLFAQMNFKEKHLPARFYEYEQLDFRREQAGELAGIQRLRGFHMPDLHTLCADLPQSVDEFQRQYELCKHVMEEFGLKSHVIYRTTKDFFEENKAWIMGQVAKEGTPALLELWEERYYYFILKFERAVLSAQGKSSTLATIQIDVESGQDVVEYKSGPVQKYNITYEAEDGTRRHPIILHTSPSGGVERVLWGILESNIRNQTKVVAGFRFWIAPIQVRIVTVTDKEDNYAEELLEKLDALHFRVDYDDRNEKIGKKIRSAEKDWVNYVVVLGSKEVENKTVSVRKRRVGEPLGGAKGSSERLDDIPLDEFLGMLAEDQGDFPKHRLPKPFQRFSTRFSFR